MGKTFGCICDYISSLSLEIRCMLESKCRLKYGITISEQHMVKLFQVNWAYFEKRKGMANYIH